jgi:hypothetical protein
MSAVEVALLAGAGAWLVWFWKRASIAARVALVVGFAIVAIQTAAGA